MNDPDISTDSMLGWQIGNYRVEKELASGGFGTVFLAQHIHLQRVAVIKLLHSLHLKSEEERAQFMREGQILEKLRGLPFILPMLDFGIEPTIRIPYMVMEYAEKGSLRDLIKRRNGPCPLDKALTVFGQIGQGLQAAHGRQIVHRDLKPENVLFNARGEVMLADFGISTVLTNASVKYTQVAGSPAYMAPEQFRGMVSKESDQYALACIMYELLTGVRPFTGSCFVAVSFQHVSTPPPPLRARNPQIPDYVEHAILKALAKERHDRFPTVSAFVEALQRPGASYAPTAYSTQPPIQPTVPASRQFVPPSPRSVAAQTPLITPPAPPPPCNTTDPAVTPQPYGLATDPYASPSYRGPTAYSAANPYATISNPYESASAAYSSGNARSYASFSPQTPPEGQFPHAAVPADPFLSLSSAGLRALAVLNYLFSPFALVFCIPLYAFGRGNRFARFHFMQALLFWLHIILLFTFFYFATGGSTPYDQTDGIQKTFTCIAGLWLFLVFGLVVSLSVATLMGRYFKIPLLGQLSEKYAERGRRYAQLH